MTSPRRSCPQCGAGAERSAASRASDVALLKRLRKSKDWLYALCVQLFQEHGIAVATDGGFQIRAFDATTVKEPGKTGALWRIHWSVCLPSLACDFFRLTPTEGPGSGESLVQFPIRHASASSPWGYELAPSAATQCVA